MTYGLKHGGIVTLLRESDTPLGSPWVAVAESDLQEIANRPPPELPEETDAERIARIQWETDAIYSSLPLDVQAAFATVYVAAKDFIVRGKLDVAAALIGAQMVPPELEAAKQAIVDKLR